MAVIFPGHARQSPASPNFAAIENDESGRSTSDWRNRIQSAPADQKETVIAQAVREVVGSVLRVKPDTLRDDQPLTDLGLDSLMGVEIENSLEAAIGVALPPTSLMRARTIGQIAALMMAHIGGNTPATPAPVVPATLTSGDSDAVAAEVDLDALSTKKSIDSLAMATMRILCWRQRHMPEDKRARLKQWLESGEAQLHPLTFPQRELWEASPAPPTDVSNHICCVIRVVA